MKQIKILTYSIDFSLSNIYLKVMIQPLEPRIFDEKNEVILYKKKNRIKPQLSHKIS